MYVIGKEEMKIRHRTNIFRRVLLMMFLWLRENSRTKMADVNIPTNNLVKIGFMKEI
jgi:KUP system potassium uptake protein